MLIALAPIVVLTVGLLMWVLSSNPKVSEAGKILFFCGALVLTFTLAEHTFRVGGVLGAGTDAPVRLS